MRFKGMRCATIAFHVLWWHWVHFDNILCDIWAFYTIPLHLMCLNGIWYDSTSIQHYLAAFDTFSAAFNMILMHFNGIWYDLMTIPHYFTLFDTLTAFDKLQRHWIAPQRHSIHFDSILCHSTGIPHCSMAFDALRWHLIWFDGHSTLFVAIRCNSIPKFPDLSLAVRLWFGTEPAFGTKAQLTPTSSIFLLRILVV